MWQYENEITGVLGFSDGYIQVEKGLLVTPLEQLTENQKTKLENSLLWSKIVPSAKIAQAEEPSSLEQKEETPPKKRRGRKPSKKKE
jgi:hypothetical protein